MNIVGIVIFVCVILFLIALLRAIERPVAEEPKPVKEDTPKPDVSEPVLSIIDSMLCTDEWNYYYTKSSTWQAFYHTYIHMDSGLSVTFSTFSYIPTERISCREDWATDDEKNALISAHKILEQRRPAEETNLLDSIKQEERAKYSNVFVK